jgi:tetratricopeptide (TPR) repeat protein
MRRLLAALVIVMLARGGAAQRIASDFEIEQMEKQLARSGDFLSRLSGRLNLGDLRLSRNETSLARAEYRKALELAMRERDEARRVTDLARYATATSYAALATAKLGDAARAFELAEEAVRYTSGDAKTWNLYASAMTVAGQTRKAAGASRNAVAIAEEEARRTPSTANLLDLAVYRYALASSVGDAEAETLLQRVVESLRGKAFESLRRQAARSEAFEIYSSARGEQAAYLSLLNRAQLRLAALYERRGDSGRARAMYESVLQSRSDDPVALAALARLPGGDRERTFADAFDANPFSRSLIASYRAFLASGSHPPAEGSGPGTRMRRALQQLAAGQNVAARATLEELRARYPDNDVVRELLLETRQQTDGVPSFFRTKPAKASPTPAELRQTIALFAQNRITAEQRVALDTIVFTSAVTFTPLPDAKPAAGQTVFASGTIGGVPFRFSEPTAFAGVLPREAHLTYRILGATEVDGADGLLLEPLGVQP